MNRDDREQLLLDVWEEFDRMKTVLTARFDSPDQPPAVYLVVEQCRTHLVTMLRRQLLTPRRSWWRVLLRRPPRHPIRPSVVDVYLDALTPLDSDEPDAGGSTARPTPYPVRAVGRERE